VEQTTVTSHVKDLLPSNGISVRSVSGDQIWSLAVLAYQANWLFWQLGPQQVRKLKHWDRSACDVWTIYQGPVHRQGCADCEHRPV